MMDLKNNTILITGGATGIGFAFVEALLKEGNEVIICGRRKEKLLEAKEKHPELHIMVCDITIEEERHALFQYILTQFPKLNILINNAGIQRTIDLTKGEDELLKGDSEIKINFEAPVYLTSLFIPLLRTKDHAAIINVSSGLGFLPSATMPIYSATKAAMHMYSISLRKQLKNTSIRVFEAIPPYIPDTELNSEGRAKRKIKLEGPSAKEYVEEVIKGIKIDQFEIGYGQRDFKNQTRKELEDLFESRDF